MTSCRKCYPSLRPWALLYQWPGRFSAPLLPVKPSSVTSPPRIHQVQQGETLNQIARKYQVSRDELIKLNKIPNSNIIFVDQRLKIPATAVKNQDDPHIAKLRTEIELLRAQSRQQKSESGNKLVEGIDRNDDTYKPTATAAQLSSSNR